MPVFVNDFEWKQTEQTVIIIVGLRNQNIHKVNIVCTSSYLKVSFNPYLLEIFLSEKILPDKSSSVFRDGSLHILLHKADIGDWNQIVLPTKNKSELSLLRKQALQEYEELENLKLKSRKDGKKNVQDLAVSKQIVENEARYQRQKRLIEEEKAKFFQEKPEESLRTEDSKEARLRHSSFCSEDDSTVASEGDYDGDGEESIGCSSSENTFRFKDETKKEKGEVSSNSICSNVRESCTIRIRHSEHDRTLPRRYSTSSSKPQEETLLSGSSQDDRCDEDIAELKGKAVKCFTDGDFVGAVKFYTTLIELTPKQASYYSNRAAAHIALRDYEESIADCSKALELLFPANEENAKSRLLCLVRRGTSLIRLSDAVAGLADYEAALEIDPNNISLAKDVAVVKASLDNPLDESDILLSGSESSSDDSETQPSSSEEMNNLMDEVS